MAIDKKAKVLLALGQLGVGVGGLVFKLAPLVIEKIGDGVVTADEAEELASAILADNPDLIRVKVKGQDVVDTESEAHLVKAVVRIVADIVANVA